MVKDIWPPQTAIKQRMFVAFLIKRLSCVSGQKLAFSAAFAFLVPLLWAHHYFY